MSIFRSQAGVGATSRGTDGGGGDTCGRREGVGAGPCFNKSSPLILTQSVLGWRLLRVPR